MRLSRLVLAILLGLSLGPALLRAQGAVAPSASDAARAETTPAPRARAERTLTFQLVLLTAEVDGPGRFENVPANARKALEDVREFLPYKSYRLLDMAWIRSSRLAEAQLSGPDGGRFSAQIRFQTADDESRLDITRFVIVDSAPPTPRLETNRESNTSLTAPPPPIRPIIESTFGMRVGETVVVGTARLDGPSRALVILLTALP